MNPQIKSQWTQALRSGEFLQGNSKLRDFHPTQGDHTFCCLGVLTQLFINEHPDACWAQSPSFRERANLEVNGVIFATSYLPFPVAQWAGLDSGHVPVQPLGRDTSLAYLNDQGTSFEKIADIIEECL